MAESSVGQDGGRPHRRPWLGCSPPSGVQAPLAHKQRPHAAPDPGHRRVSKNGGGCMGSLAHCLNPSIPGTSGVHSGYKTIPLCLLLYKFYLPQESAQMPASFLRSVPQLHPDPTKATLSEPSTLNPAFPGTLLTPPTEHLFHVAFDSSKLRSHL